MQSNLRIDVAFTKTPTIHVVARAKGSQKRLAKTLCGLAAADMGKMAPFEVGANRPNVDGSEVPKNPFYGPRGCLVCWDGLSC